MTSNEEFEEEIDASAREGGLLGLAYSEHRSKRERLIKEYYAVPHTLEETSERFRSSHSYIIKVLGAAYIEPVEPEPDKEDNEFGPIHFGF